MLQPGAYVVTHDGQFKGTILSKAITHAGKPQNWAVRWDDGMKDVVAESDVREVLGRYGDQTFASQRRND